MKRSAVFSLLILLYLYMPALALQVPQYHGYVNDFADMISPGAEQQLEQTLQVFDQTDSTQVAVLTIESLEGDSLEEFSIRVADDWKIGQGGRDNGVLLLFAKQDRKIRIEVGRGLEGVLTDLAAGRIIDNVITPLFKGGRFDEGVAAGIDAIVKTTRGEFSGADEQRGLRNRNTKMFIPYLFISFFVLVMLSNSISRPLVSAVGAAALPLSVFLGLPALFSPAALLFLAAIGGLGGFLIQTLLAVAQKKAQRQGKSIVSRRGKKRRGGRIDTGNGFRSSSGSSSGGFGSFGGGGFGGGGASGGW